MVWLHFKKATRNGSQNLSLISVRNIYCSKDEHAFCLFVEFRMAEFPLLLALVISSKSSVCTHVHWLPIVCLKYTFTLKDTPTLTKPQPKRRVEPVAWLEGKT